MIALIRKLLALCLCVLPCVGLVGCSALATAMWITGASDVKPEYDGFKDKKVAVVARPVVALTYRDAHVDKELARRIQLILTNRVRKAQWIDQQKVEKWLDEHEWETFPEVGKGVGADLVIGVEIEDFSLYKGQTVYQGTATLRVAVYDCATNQKVYEKSLSNINYPPNSVVPTSEVPESVFRREFLSVLAEAVARLFHSYDPHEFWALDTRTLR
ncbi:MAG TPA: hypothetical protein PKI05_12475 [Thermogutta sp.]|mgnify:CR=1 FL=1|nr:hypothetical protein [Thermogutta sp.]HQF12995.1 hypothetical protein [Thermogutta sp.]